MTQDSPIDASKTEPSPPWLIFPGEAPFYTGFKQGGMGGYQRDVFLRFWCSLNAEQRIAYLDKWPVPDEYWHCWLYHVEG